MWKGLFLIICCVSTYVMAAPAAPADQHHRTKRAVPAFVVAAAKDVGKKVVDALGDRIAEGVVENHQEKVVSALEEYFSGQFDKADEEFDQVMERSGDLLSGLGGNVEQATVKLIHGRGLNTGDSFSPAGYEIRMKVDREQKSDGGDQDSSDGMKPAAYPSGVGPVLMNGCFGANYQPGDPCYGSSEPLAICVKIIDGATVLGVGFDGRGEYSTDSRKKSLIERACKTLQTYHGLMVPDPMTVQGIYDTDVETYSFTSMEEYRIYLEDKSAVTSAKAMFQQEMNKAQGHLAVSGPFGLFGSAGGGLSYQSGSDTQTSSFSASSSASAQQTQTSTRTFMAMMELNIFRYEIFLDYVSPESLNLAFLRDFLALPETYFAIGADREFQQMILRWGTHLVTSAKFGGQLKMIKTKEASATDSQKSFAQAAQSEFKQVFSTYSALQTQTKSSSWIHDHETNTETSSSAGGASSGTTSQSSLSEESSFSQTEFSNEMMIVQGGDQMIAGAVAEFYTPSFADSLKLWLESIEVYPKAFEFSLQLISDLLNINFDSLFPLGDDVDYGCFANGQVLEVDEAGRRYYVKVITDGNTTSSEIRYCNFIAREDLAAAMTKRRLALKRAIAVYLEEGPFLSSDFQIPAGEPGCETAELVLLEESNAGAPSWDTMKSGDEFKVVFDLPFNIPNFLDARAALYVKFLSKIDSWLTIRDGVAPHQFDAYQNGNSGDITLHKISVGGLVVTYDENSGMFHLTEEDFDASKLVITALPDWIKGLHVARAEFKSLLEQLSNQQSGGQMPCNLKWSNAHRIDPTDGGKCIHFTAASEGDIFLVFAGIPKDHDTWITLEISTGGVAMYKALRFAVSQLEKGARGLGSDILYQSYFVCITENLTESTTTVQFGKTPDNEERAHVWLDYLFHGVLSLHYYAFGSGDHAVKLMGVSQMEKPTGDGLVCREGTNREGDRCVQVCHYECIGCRTTGSDDPRDCIGCKHVKVPYPYISGSEGDFMCAAFCPAGMTLTPGTSICQCIKRMEATAADGTVPCVASCPLTHYDDNGVCKRCSSFCLDVSANGTAVCSGPSADDCTVCILTAPGGSCVQCNPGQKAVPIAAGTGNNITCVPCAPGHKCRGDELEEICPADTYSNANRTDCEPCPAGTHSTAGSTHCMGVRLVGNSDTNKGTVEVMHDGEWGTVCGHGVNQEFGKVVCRQLGFEHMIEFRSFIGPRAVQIWLSNVQCSGLEDRVDQCEHDPWGVVPTCVHTDDVGVVCARTCFWTELNCSVNVRCPAGTVVRDTSTCGDNGICCPFTYRSLCCSEDDTSPFGNPIDSPLDFLPSRQ